MFVSHRSGGELFVSNRSVGEVFVSNRSGYLFHIGVGYGVCFT